MSGDDVLVDARAGLRRLRAAEAAVAATAGAFGHGMAAAHDDDRLATLDCVEQV